jgi:hypothetical protein
MSTLNTATGINIFPSHTNPLVPVLQPAQIAQSILADTQVGSSAHNIEKIEAHLVAIAANEPATASLVRAETMKALSHTEQGELSRLAGGPNPSVKDSIEEKAHVSRSYIPGIVVKPGDIGIWFPDSYFNLKDYYTISAHGGPHGVAGVPNSQSRFDAKVQAEAIYADINNNGWDKKKPIILLVCNLGNGKVPKELAKIAKVPVYAATGFVVGSVGLTTARQDVQTEDGGSNGGRFLQFNPNGTEQNPFNIKDEFAVVGLERTFYNELKPITVPVGKLVKTQ